MYRNSKKENITFVTFGQIEKNKFNRLRMFYCMVWLYESGIPRVAQIFNSQRKQIHIEGGRYWRHRSTLPYTPYDGESGVGWTYAKFCIFEKSSQLLYTFYIDKYILVLFFLRSAWCYTCRLVGEGEYFFTFFILPRFRFWLWLLLVRRRCILAPSNSLQAQSCGVHGFGRG